MSLAKRILSANDHERLIPVVDRARQVWLTYAPYQDLFRSELRRSRAGALARRPRRRDHDEQQVPPLTR